MQNTGQNKEICSALNGDMLFKAEHEIISFNMQKMKKMFLSCQDAFDIIIRQ